MVPGLRPGAIFYALKSWNFHCASSFQRHDLLLYLIFSLERCNTRRNPIFSLSVLFVREERKSGCSAVVRSIMEKSEHHVDAELKVVIRIIDWNKLWCNLQRNIIRGHKKVQKW